MKRVFKFFTRRKVKGGSITPSSGKVFSGARTEEGRNVMRIDGSKVGKGRV